jgi:hypothetical protein
LNRPIRALLFVTKLSRVDAHKDKATGWGDTLKCASYPGCCGKKQEPPVQLSRDRKSEVVCLQELLKRLQDRHVDCAEDLAEKAAADAVSTVIVNPDAPNVLEAMVQLEQARTRAKEHCWMPLTVGLAYIGNVSLEINVVVFPQICCVSTSRCHGITCNLRMKGSCLRVFGRFHRKITARTD